MAGWAPLSLALSPLLRRGERECLASERSGVGGCSPIRQLAVPHLTIFHLAVLACMRFRGPAPARQNGFLSSRAAALRLWLLLRWRRSPARRRRSANLRLQAFIRFEREEFLQHFAGGEFIEQLSG